MQKQGAREKWEKYIFSSSISKLYIHYINRKERWKQKFPSSNLNALF